MFAESMVVGTPSLRRVRDGGYHPGRLRGASGIRNDIEGAAIANKQFRMSSFAVRQETLETVRRNVAIDREEERIAVGLSDDVQGLVGTVM